MIINPPEIERVGGKALQLYRLREHFDSIPPFFTIVFEKADEIESLSNREEIINICKSMDMKHVAVRSSANFEDLPNANFPGMFKSVLNVDLDSLIEAIREVLNSVHNKRVIDYCHAQGIELIKLRMSVIVQQMVNSQVSGVCFSRNNENPQSAIIEACYGLGEALVSGDITPDTYYVDRTSLEITRASIGYQRYYLTLLGDDAGTARKPLPFYKRNSKKLTNSQIRDIAKISFEIESILNLPSIDMEWALEDGILHILQARPYSGYFANKSQGEHPNNGWR